MSDTKCPYCQSEKYDNSIPQIDMAGNTFLVEDFFLCGSSPNFRPELCHEREAHNQTKRERNELQEKYDTLAVENMLEVHMICKQRDEAMDMLSKLSHFFGCGIGDENTTAKQFYHRIIKGFTSNNN